jgi:hypothetical protein
MITFAIDKDGLKSFLLCIGSLCKYVIINCATCFIWQRLHIAFLYWKKINYQVNRFLCNRKLHRDIQQEKLFYRDRTRWQNGSLKKVVTISLINTNFPRDLTKNDIFVPIFFPHIIIWAWEKGKMLCYCHSLMHMEINFNHELPMIWQIINYGKFFSLKRKHIEPCSKWPRLLLERCYFFRVTKQIFHVWWFLIFFFIYFSTTKTVRQLPAKRTVKAH